MLAAADCAEGKAPPPQELEYAWQAQAHPGALPNAGGLRDQPVALMTKMRVCLNVWSAFKEYFANEQSVKWTQKNHDKWEIIVSVGKLRSGSGEQ